MRIKKNINLGIIGGFNIKFSEPTAQELCGRPYKQKIKRKLHKFCKIGICDALCITCTFKCKLTYKLTCTLTFI